MMKHPNCYVRPTVKPILTLLRFYIRKITTKVQFAANTLIFIEGLVSFQDMSHYFFDLNMRWHYSDISRMDISTLYSYINFVRSSNTSQELAYS